MIKSKDALKTGSGFAVMAIAIGCLAASFAMPSAASAGGSETTTRLRAPASIAPFSEDDPGPAVSAGSGRIDSLLAQDSSNGSIPATQTSAVVAIKYRTTSKSGTRTTTVRVPIRPRRFTPSQPHFAHGLSIAQRQIAEHAAEVAAMLTPQAKPRQTTSSTTTVVERLQRDYGQSQVAEGVDVRSQVQDDGLGGFDRQFGIDLRRSIGGLDLGMQVGDESRRSGAADSSSAPDALDPASIQTLQYSAEEEFSKLLSFNATWQSVVDSSSTSGGQQSVTATTKLALAPSKEFGISQADVTAGITSDTGGGSPASRMRRLTFDSSLTKLRSLLKIASLTSVHLELGQSDTGAGSWAGSMPQEIGSQTINLSGALAAIRQSHWSYTLTSQSASGAALTQPSSSRDWNISLPVRRINLSYEDRSQSFVSGDYMLRSTGRHISLSGPVRRSALTLGADYDQGVDFTTGGETHRSAVGVHISGSPGPCQNIGLGLSRLSESETGNGSQSGLLANLSYNFQPRNRPTRLTINCDTATNNYDNRTGAKDNIDATVHADLTTAF